MKIATMSAIILVGTVLVSGPAGAEAQETPEFSSRDAARGESSFRTYCSACHGRDAKGDGPLGKDLKVPPANLTLLSEKRNGEFPYQDVYKTIEGGKRVRGHGSTDMPAWGDAFLTTDSKEEATRRIHHLCQFIWSVQTKK